MAWIRRIAKELKDSGVDRFIRPGMGISIGSLSTSRQDDPYNSYEANILWDQDELSDSDQRGSVRQEWWSSGR